MCTLLHKHTVYPQSPATLTGGVDDPGLLRSVREAAAHSHVPAVTLHLTQQRLLQGGWKGRVRWLIAAAEHVDARRLIAASRADWRQPVLQPRQTRLQCPDDSACQRCCNPPARETTCRCPRGPPRRPARPRSPAQAAGGRMQLLGRMQNRWCNLAPCRHKLLLLACSLRFWHYPPALQAACCYAPAG